MELQERSIIWHYGNADVEFGEIQAGDLQTHIEKVLTNVPVEVLLGCRRVEVRPYGISKGVSFEEILEEMGYDMEEGGIEKESGEMGPELVRQTSLSKEHSGGFRKKVFDEAALGTPKPIAVPKDFVLVMGSFSHRDEDLFTVVRDEKLKGQVMTVDPITINVSREVNSPMPSLAEYNIGGLSDAKKMVMELAQASAAHAEQTDALDDDLIERIQAAAEELKQAKKSRNKKRIDNARAICEELKIHEELAMPLDSALAEFGSVHALCKNKRVAFFLDYDGTLTPIVNNPDLAIINDSTRDIVKNLSLHYPTAIVTGRTQQKAKNFMQLEDLYYAGSHGFDIVGPRDVQYQVSEGARPALEEISRVIGGQVDHIRGSMIEDNTFSVSVHYRNVAPELHQQVEDIVNAALIDFPMLKRSDGKMVHELRPEIDWHKGKAVEYLLETIQADYVGQEIVPIYIGDDTTDEDAFRSLLNDGGIGIIVRDTVCRRDETDAMYFLTDPLEVSQFLQKFVELAPELGSEQPKSHPCSPALHYKDTNASNSKITPAMGIPSGINADLAPLDLGQSASSEISSNAISSVLSDPGLAAPLSTTDRLSDSGAGPPKWASASTQ